MATVKSVSSFALFLIVVAMAANTSMAQAPGCVAQLPNLNSCAPFVVPGNNAVPSADCCNALSTIEHGCLCNTLRIAAQIPAKCNLAALTCGP